MNKIFSHIPPVRSARHQLKKSSASDSDSDNHGIVKDAMKAAVPLDDSERAERMSAPLTIHGLNSVLRTFKARIRTSRSDNPKSGMRFSEEYLDLFEAVDVPLAIIKPTQDANSESDNERAGACRATFHDSELHISEGGENRLESESFVQMDSFKSNFLQMQDISRDDVKWRKSSKVHHDLLKRLVVAFLSDVFNYVNKVLAVKSKLSQATDCNLIKQAFYKLKDYSTILNTDKRNNVLTLASCKILLCHMSDSLDNSLVLDLNEGSDDKRLYPQGLRDTLYLLLPLVLLSAPADSGIFACAEPKA